MRAKLLKAAQKHGVSVMTEEEITATREPRPVQRCGIYFLLGADGSILYIGQSVNAGARVLDHSRHGILHRGERHSFHSWSFVPCEKKMLNFVESLYIHLLKPPLNGTQATTGEKVAPRSIKHVASGCIW